MILIIAKDNLKPGTRDEYLKLAKEMEAETQKEAGCIFYDLYEDMQDPQSFCFVEKYIDQDAVDFHNQSPHFKTIVPLLSKFKNSSNVTRYQLAKLTDSNNQ